MTSLQEDPLGQGGVKKNSPGIVGDTPAMTKTDQRPEVGDQSEEQTSRRVEEDDGWLGSKEDQEYFLSTEMPYTDLSYRPGPVRRRKSIHVDEDDLLRKEDDWLVEEDRVPTPNPS